MQHVETIFRRGAEILEQTRHCDGTVSGDALQEGDEILAVLEDSGGPDAWQSGPLAHHAQAVGMESAYCNTYPGRVEEADRLDNLAREAVSRAEPGQYLWKASAPRPKRGAEVAELSSGRRRGRRRGLPSEATE